MVRQSVITPYWKGCWNQARIDKVQWCWVAAWPWETWLHLPYHFLVSCMLLSRDTRDMFMWQHMQKAQPSTFYRVGRTELSDYGTPRRRQRLKSTRATDTKFFLSRCKRVTELSITFLYSQLLYRTPDNARFVSSGGDRDAFLWDVQSGQTVRRFKGHTSKINAVQFNPEASVLATGEFDTFI